MCVLFLKQASYLARKERRTKGKRQAGRKEIGKGERKEMNEWIKMKFVRVHENLGLGKTFYEIIASDALL